MMTTLRFTAIAHWEAIESHLAGAKGERFAFALTRLLADQEEGPILEVEDIELVRDDEVEHDRTGWTIKDVALDRVHNRAITEQRGLVEFHNHRFGPPGFSHTDEIALEPMARYVVELLGRPYGAAVWTDDELHAEWFRVGNEGIDRGIFRSVTVVGGRLRLLNARELDEQRFKRQIPILGSLGQAMLRGLRVAVVGSGGTGSHAITSLAYLGVRDFVIYDDDVVEVTNLNRVVTADPADIDASKTLVARRRVLSLDREAHVEVMAGLTSVGDHSELLDVDLIVGCVDHDGPRHRLNQIAVQGGVPYVDIGTGVDSEVDPIAVGGRVSFVLPGGPCLACTEELDPLEVARWYKSVEQQAVDRAHGYGMMEPAPSVVHLNGLAVNAAVAEIVAWISGARPPATRLDIDLGGDPALPGTRIAPSNDRTRRAGCVDCSWRYAAQAGTSAA
jgi:molybdopterin/thiamine biosynthesis adenylyltransferase